MISQPFGSALCPPPHAARSRVKQSPGPLSALSTMQRNKWQNMNLITKRGRSDAGRYSTQQREKKRKKKSECQPLFITLRDTKVKALLKDLILSDKLPLTHPSSFPFSSAIASLQFIRRCSHTPATHDEGERKTLGKKKKTRAKDISCPRRVSRP